MPFRTHDPRLLRASLFFFVLAALVGGGWYGCATQPLAPGLVMREGASNGPENENRLGVLMGYSFLGLRAGITPARKNGMAHPIVDGDVINGFITQGTANKLPDRERLTPANYSGFVLAQPGLDWRFIQ